MALKFKAQVRCRPTGLEVEIQSFILYIPHHKPNPSIYVGEKQDTFSHEELRFAIFSIRAGVT